MLKEVMTLASKVTFLRIILSPVFFIFFMLLEFAGEEKIFIIILLWLIFIIIELSDLFDGILARKMKEESQLGKILDPFADSFSRLTYFICFSGIKIMPLWILLILVYRDLTVSFFRIYLSKKGFLHGSRWSGKIKAWIYAFAGISGMLYISFKKLLIFSNLIDMFSFIKDIIFILCAGVAIFSVFDYSSIFWRKKNIK